MLGRSQRRRLPRRARLLRGAITRAASREAETISRRASGCTFEKELLGFYVSGHPMNAYTGLAEALDTFHRGQVAQPARSHRIPPLRHRAGNLVKKLSKKGQPSLGRLHARDEDGVALRSTCLPTPMRLTAQNLAENATRLVQGNIIVSEEGARINVKECYPLDAHLPPTSAKSPGCCIQIIPS